MKKVLCMVFMIALGVSLPGTAKEAEAAGKKKVVAIDAGH